MNAITTIIPSEYLKDNRVSLLFGMLITVHIIPRLIAEHYTTNMDLHFTSLRTWISVASPGDPKSGGHPRNTENPYEHTHFVIYASHFFFISLIFPIARRRTLRSFLLFFFFFPSISSRLCDENHFLLLLLFSNVTK